MGGAIQKISSLSIKTHKEIGAKGGNQVDRGHYIGMQFMSHSSFEIAILDHLANV